MEVTGGGTLKRNGSERRSFYKVEEDMSHLQTFHPVTITVSSFFKQVWIGLYANITFYYYFINLITGSLCDSYIIFMTKFSRYLHNIHNSQYSVPFCDPNIIFMTKFSRYLHNKHILNILSSVTLHLGCAHDLLRQENFQV